MNTLCGQNSVLQHVNVGCTHNNHWPKTTGLSFQRHVTKIISEADSIIL